VSIGSISTRASISVVVPTRNEARDCIESLGLEPGRADGPPRWGDGFEIVEPLERDPDEPPVDVDTGAAS
jgi:hypothetical protein